MTCRISTSIPVLLPAAATPWTRAKVLLLLLVVLHQQQMHHRTLETTSTHLGNAGIFLVDLESRSSNAKYRALLAIWDDSGNLIASSILDFGNAVDKSRGFVGITSSQPFSYISIWVGGSTTTSPIQFAHALGGFTFRTAEIPEPTTLVSLGILALLLVGRALFRKSLQAHYVGKAARS